MREATNSGWGQIIPRWLLLLFLVPAALGVLALVVIVVNASGVLNPSPDELIAKGNALVVAVERYQAQHGQLPSNLAEIPEDSLPPGIDRSNWVYYPGYDHEHKKPVFTLGSSSRPHVVNYQSSERKWEVMPDVR